MTMVKKNIKAKVKVETVIADPAKEKKLKYIFFSYYMGQAGSVAWQLQRQGSIVDFAQITDEKQVLTDDEQKTFKPGDPEMEKRRLSTFDGLLKKHDADGVIKILSELQNKEDYFIFCDNNNCFRYTEKALAAGFTKGTFPTQADRLLEVNRDDAKDIVKEHYPGIKLKDYKVFKTAEEGIEYMKESEHPYVLKSMGDAGETVVPKTKNLEINRKEVCDALANNKKDYEEHGYLLEQKIIDGIEFTPEMIFWNGVPVMASIDLETKTIGAGETGGNVGCGTNLIIRTELNDPINDKCFPPYIREKCAGTIGMRTIDLAVLIDQEDGEMYFLEFCPNRVGWDSFPTDITMADGAESFFEKISQGKNPLKYKYGAALRIFNDTQDHDRYPAAGQSIIFSEDLYDYVFPYDVKASEKKEEEDETPGYLTMETAGWCKDAAVITCKSDSLKDVISMIYNDYLKDFSLKDMQYRSLDDFFSFSYSQSIFNRLKYLVEKGILKDAKIKKDLQEVIAMPKAMYTYEKPDDTDNS